MVWVGWGVFCLFLFFFFLCLILFVLFILLVALKFLQLLIISYALYSDPSDMEHGKVLTGLPDLWAVVPQGVKLNQKLIAVEGGKV